MGKAFDVTRLAFVALLNLVVHNVYLGFVLGCHDAERQALSQFRKSFVNDPYKNFDSWKGADCCQWDAVTCNNVTGYVNSLVFSGVGYSIYASGELSLTAHMLDPSLIELRHLNHLDLRGCDFQGSKIPGFIGSFKHLRHLDLSGANFSTVFPPQLGNLTNLQYLSVSGPKEGHFQRDSALVNSQHPDKNEFLVSNTRNTMQENEFLVSNTRNTMQVFATLPSLTYLQVQSCGLTNSPNFYRLLSNATWLSKIKTLDLSDNLLAGPLSIVFSNMSSLVHLDLSDNLLNGSIPLWLKNMRNLEHLELSYNSFKDVEGGVIMRILETPSKLKSLGIVHNSLGGVLSVSDPHGNFSKGVSPDLEEFYLQTNEIMGSLPSWLGEFKKLWTLDIGGNRISGNIPASIGNLTDLGYLNLNYNSLDGAIPEGFGQLDNLYWVDLSFNLLDGLVSDSNLANLSSLATLILNNNRLNVKFSNDWIPPFELFVLRLSSCRIDAKLPRWIKSHTSILALDLSNAGIFGESLHFLCKFSHLTSVDLHGNEFFATIPDNCFKRGHLLRLINFSSNKLSGPIPESIGLLLGLKFLNLNNNSLEGGIPQSFSLLRDLIIMDLGDNSLSGGLPNLRPNKLRDFNYLRLRSNKLNGSVPECLCSLPSIRLLDLSNNKLTGSVPPCIGELGGMRFNNTISLPPHYEDNIFTHFGESAVEVLKGAEMQYTRNLQFLVDLDLSSNELVGSIPESITNLTGLVGFNLSHNRLTGHIPYKIGEMRSLESLDLSNNHLYGTIPSSLGALTSLASFNVSNNQLHGQIPTGNQLQVLDDPSIYAGNTGLCGDPLPNKCRTTNGQQQQLQQQQESEKEDAREKILLYFVIFSGFATGFWGFVGSLILKERFRFALFHLFSNATDYCYVQTMLRINRFRN